MNDRRTIVLVATVVAALLAVPLSASAAPAAPATHDAPGLEASTGATPLEATPLQSTDRDDDPATNETIGYVEGYWYDDELAVDDRERAALSEAELEAVVYRSMARVEVLRDLAFEEAVGVDVVSREAFREESSERFEPAGEDERLARNVHYEALFMVDRETDARRAYETLYGDAVVGYYDPVPDEIVIVSDSPDEPEVDEVILGHELLHALQDQHFGLQGYERNTLDRAHANDGLIEGDAVRLETAYSEQCGAEWSCVLPGSVASSQPTGFNTGLFLTVIQPYADGPGYVDHLYETGGWAAVDDAYEEPPASSAEVIRPGDDRPPANADYEDRSSDHWEPLESDGNTERVGEAGMAAMFMTPTLDGRDGAVLETGDVYTGEGNNPYDYDHEVTDGWAGDELVAYATEDRTIDETAYVWETEWLDEAHAEEFLAGYLALLEVYGAEPVDDRADAYVIDEAFPGAYALEADGESVTIVRAPTVDELSEVRAGIGSEGEDAIDVDSDRAGSDRGEGAGSDGAGGPSDSDGAADRLSGFGLGVAVAALGAALMLSRRR